MRHGEIWLARLNPNTGVEIGKVRPVLILLAQRYLNAGAPVIMAAPLTTRCWPGMAALVKHGKHYGYQVFLPRVHETANSMNAVLSQHGRKLNLGEFKLQVQHRR